MTRRTITGFSNPTVKLLRSLRDKKHRKREGKFLAEGLRLLTDARESGRVPEMLVMAEGRDDHPLLQAVRLLRRHQLRGQSSPCKGGDRFEVRVGEEHAEALPTYQASGSAE